MRPHGDVLTELISNSEAARINATVAQLPSPAREIITALFWLGQSEAAIAEDLCLTKPEVAMHKQHGMDKIEAALAMGGEKPRPK